MFKQRLKELGINILLGVCLLILIVACTWISLMLHLDKVLDILKEHQQVSLGLILLLMIAFPIYSFINWLFIEPFRAWRKSKNIK